MGSTSDEVAKLRSDLQALARIAKQYAEMPRDLSQRIETFQDEVTRLAYQGDDAAASRFQDYLEEFKSLREDVADAIKLLAVSNYHGQERIARAIESHGSDNVGAAFVSGVFQLLGSAIVGGIIGASIDRASDRVASTITAKEVGPSRENVAIRLLHQLEQTGERIRRRDFTTGLVAISGGALNRDDARKEVGKLLKGGILEAYQEAGRKLVKLNRAHPVVTELMRVEGVGRPSSQS